MSSSSVKPMQHEEVKVRAQSVHDMKLRKVWAGELKVLERVFRYMMLDMFFRLTTFNAMRYAKKDIYTLAEHGFFNAKVKKGNYRRFKLICIFCDFEFSSETFPNRELNVPNVQFQHTVASPHCFLLRKERGLSFQKASKKLGLTSVGLTYWDAIKREVIAAKPFFLDTAPKLALEGEEDNRLKCIVCLTNVRNVLTSCNHVLMCSSCFIKKSKYDQSVRCSCCRQAFSYYTKVSLPEPSFGFGNDLDNLFQKPNNGHFEEESLRMFVDMILAAGMRMAAVSGS